MAITPRRITSNLLGLTGGVIGGIFGYYLFRWFFNQGFYALVLPGAMVGLGCGLLSHHTSQIRGVLCGIAGLLLGMYCEWTYWPFKDDKSFGYLVTHIHQKETVTLGLLALGTVFAYWLGKDGGFSRFPGRVVNPPREKEPSAPSQ